MIPEVERFKSCIGQHLKIDDWQALEIVLAAVVAYKLRGEMLWLRLIGASGSGKTELLRTLLGLKDTETLESLTPSAIRRGLQLVKKDKDNPDKLRKMKLEPTLLERIDGKLVITKELAPLLTKHHDVKNEIFGLLRSVHDGELDADYGSLQGHIKQKTWFDWILGTTQYIDQQYQLELLLGSRFTDLRWGSPMLRRGAIHKAVNNVDLLSTIRVELGAIMTSLVAHANTEKAKQFEVEDWFLDLADIVAVMRTPVQRDRTSREITDQPMPELGTRVGQNFAKIAKGLQMLGTDDTRPYLTRLTWDALPPNRACVLRAMLELESEGCEITQENIERCNGAGLSQSTISYIIRDFKLLHTDELPWREHLGRYYTFVTTSMETRLAKKS